MASMQDVAQQAGVSTATVSRTYNEPHLIRPSTRQKVRAAADSLNYQPRTIRAAEPYGKASSRLSNAIGFQLIADQHEDMPQWNASYTAVLSGALSEASALGLHLLVHAADQRTLLRKLPRMVEERVIDGLLLVGIADDATVRILERWVPALVLVDNRDEAGFKDCILPDGFEGAHAATCSLLARGHKRLGFFGPAPKATSFHDRLRGFFCAHLETGLTPEPSHMIHAGSDAACEALLAKVLSEQERPTAFVAANDHYAFLAMRVCRSMGLRIPQDLSLIGFDDVSLSTQVDPPLSTVRVDQEWMGRLAVRRLHALLYAENRDDKHAPATCTMLPVELVLRESCRAI